MKSLGVAVSGGSDSMALLHLLAAGAQARGLQLHVATVDHGLRSEAATEAETVAQVCAGLGLRHDTLTWRAWDGQGNLQAEARNARYSLLAEWAAGLGMRHIALGHTRDDMAETFLMRLSRRAGVAGLAGMNARFWRDGVEFLRPLLSLERADLQGYLTSRSIDWADDPSNQDETFDRVRVRNTLKKLETIGLDTEVLADVASHMRAADEALRLATHALGQSAARTQSGDVLIDIDALTRAPTELRHRLIGAALRWITAAPYGPRSANLHEVLEQAMTGATRTLHGCLMTPDKDVLRVTRERQAVRGPVPNGALWDGRWLVSGPQDTGIGGEISALGEDIVLCAHWREAAVPRASLMASPALRVEGRLIAAPLAKFGPEFTAKLAQDRDNFHDFLLSH
ncbi:MAG: tRNA lysidine(34) synthetase TilS [Maritimibacter sp.]